MEAALMSICRWMDKEDTYIYTMEHYPAIKKEKKNYLQQHARTGDYHTKWSKSEWERQIAYDIVYNHNLIKWYKLNLFIRQKQTHRLSKLMVTKGESGGRGDKLEVWYGHIYTYLKHIYILKTDKEQGPTV